MANNIQVGENPELNIDKVRAVIETDPVIASFINGYFQQFLENDRALLNTINSKNGVRTAMLPASGWSSSAPYTQKIVVEGVTADHSPVISHYLEEGVSQSVVKARNKAYAMLDKAVTGAGSITFYCYNKKPTVDFSVLIKGE